jgi:predicted nucleotide-binding protein (sugar kinase/HSP70/actin superfamily)
MAKKVGIPRALFYYQYYPLWRAFLEELGAEIVVSDATSKKILDDGVKSCVDEACLPVKLFYGHVLNLKDRVDFLFIPRLTSVSRNEYICPKFGGLPDMIRHTIKGLPTIIDTEVNLRKSQRNLLNAAVEIGQYFGKDTRKIEKAYQKALIEYKEFRTQIKNGALPSDILSRKLYKVKKVDVDMLNIVVISHVYNLYDSYINMGMLNKLKKNNVNVITVDMIDENVMKQKVETLKKRIFWTFGRQAVGSALHILDRKDIDGVIYVMSFGCGVDSFISDLVERKIRKGSNIPFIIITIDEHSGEAGMDTRLEAFIDMIRWRGKNENYVSAFR